ncbi:MAG: response regulator [Cytophagales bacterium]|nr:response regulator [Cytophagales bacterium]
MMISKKENRKFRRVVLVDDNRASNFLHQCLLEELSLTDEIVVLSNGRQALDYLTTQRPAGEGSEPGGKDLVLVDVNMPVMNGWELLDELEHADREYLRRNAVVMLTSCTHETDAARASRLTIKGYLEKPLDEQKVSALISAMDNSAIDNSQ